MIRKIQEFLSRKASFSGFQQKKMTPLYKDVIFQSEWSTRNCVKLLWFSNFISTFFYIVASVVYDLEPF